jgi:hypothetical protein
MVSRMVVLFVLCFIAVHLRNGIRWFQSSRMYV